MCYLNGWHPFKSIRLDLVKITRWRCLVLQIWEQQKQLLRKQKSNSTITYRPTTHSAHGNNRVGLNVISIDLFMILAERG